MQIGSASGWVAVGVVAVLIVAPIIWIGVSKKSKG